MTMILEKYRQLKNQHGLFNWTVRFLKDGTYQTLGLCSFQKQQLSINREFAENAPKEEIEDVMLHEIAHALSFIRFGRAGIGHNRYWKQICREIGAKPERCYKGEWGKDLNQPQYKYELRHKETGEVFGRYLKRPSRLIEKCSACRIWIKGKKAQTEGMLEVVKIK